MKGELIEALPALEIIGVFGSASPSIWPRPGRGVRVTNTPDVLTEGVAELGIALLLAVARRIPFNDRFVRAGRWPKEGDPALSNSLAGRRLGIVGLGRIGRRVAELAEAFGMVIRYAGPRRKDDVAWRYYDDPVELARDVDCLMLTCKGGAETAGLIGREVIEALGPEGWLINIARGSVVDEAALVDALVAGRLGAAGLDVFAREPHVPERCSGWTTSCCSRTRAAPARRPAEPWAGWCSRTSRPTSPAARFDACGVTPDRDDREWPASSISSRSDLEDYLKAQLPELRGPMRPVPIGGGQSTRPIG